MQSHIQTTHRRLAGLLFACLLLAGLMPVAHATIPDIYGIESIGVMLCDAWDSFDEGFLNGIDPHVTREAFTAEMETMDRAYPDNAGILFSLGETCRWREAYADAARYYTRAIEAEEWHVAAYAARGECHEKPGMHEAARDDYGQAATLLRVALRRGYDALLAPYVDRGDEDAYWKYLMSRRAYQYEAQGLYWVALEEYEAIGAEDGAHRVLGKLAAEDVVIAAAPALTVEPEPTTDLRALYAQSMTGQSQARSAQTNAPAPTSMPAAAPTQAPTPAPAIQRPASYLVATQGGEEVLWWLKEVEYLSYNNEKSIVFERYDENGHPVAYLTMFILKDTGTEVFEAAVRNERNFSLYYKDLVTGLLYAAYRVQNAWLMPAGADYYVSFRRAGEVYTGQFAARMINEHTLDYVVLEGGTFRIDEGQGSYPLPTTRPGTVPGQPAATPQPASGGGYMIPTSAPQRQVWVDCTICGGNRGRKCDTCGGDGLVRLEKVGTDFKGRKVHEVVRCGNINCNNGWLRCIPCRGEGGRWEWK